MSKEVKSPQNNPEEIDLGQLFKLIGKAFDRFFNFFGHIINKLFLIVVWLVFFVKKNFLIIATSIFIGLLFGYIIEKRTGPIYKSTMLIKQNYNTGQNLYNTLEYFNDLLAEENYDALSKELSADVSYISSIKSFSIKPFITENEIYVNYSNYLSNLDSMLASEYDYELYLEKIDDSNYAMQLLTITGANKDNFKLISDKISENINSLPFFKREQEKDITELENRSLAIIEAIKESDSLQKTYKQVLENSLDPENGFQTSITFEGSDEKNKTREYDLYKSDIELRAQLVDIERQIEDKKYILETISDMPDRGFLDPSISFLGKDFDIKFLFAALFMFLTFFILLILKLFKFLEKFKYNY